MRVVRRVSRQRLSVLGNRVRVAFAWTVRVRLLLRYLSNGARERHNTRTYWFAAPCDYNVYAHRSNRASTEYLESKKKKKNNTSKSLSPVLPPYSATQPYRPERIIIIIMVIIVIKIVCIACAPLRTDVMEPQSCRVRT